MADIFEKATKLRLRFMTEKGVLSTEDLWSLPLTSKNGLSLNGIAVAVNKSLKASTEESFVEEKPSENPILRLKLEIIKRIIEVKKEEAASAATARERAERKQNLLKLIREKEEGAMSEKSLEELKAELEKL